MMTMGVGEAGGIKKYTCTVGRGITGSNSMCRRGQSEV